MRSTWLSQFFFSRFHWRTCTSAREFGETNMNTEPLIMLLICVGLLVYLVYAMLRPEKF